MELSKPLKIFLFDLKCGDDEKEQISTYIRNLINNNISAFREYFATKDILKLFTSLLSKRKPDSISSMVVDKNMFNYIFLKAKRFMLQQRAQMRSTFMKFNQTISFDSYVVDITNLTDRTDSDLLNKIQSYYSTLILRYINKPTTLNIFFASLDLVFKSLDSNPIYFTISVPLKSDLMLNENYIISELKNADDNYNEIVDHYFILNKIRLRLYHDPSEKQPLLLAFGPVRKTSKSVFSPVLFNWFCCISEIACFLKLRNTEFIINKDYKYLKKREWAYLNIYCLTGDFFEESIKKTFYSGDIKEFVIKWNFTQKYLDIVLYNSVTSNYFPIPPLPVTNYIIFWYPNHVEILSPKDMETLQPLKYSLSPPKSIYLPNRNVVICSLDIETFSESEDGTQIPYLICVYSSEFQLSFKQTEDNDIISEFVDFLKLLKKNRNTKYYIWAHNGMKFDYLFLLPYIIKEFNIKLYGKLNDLKSIQLGNIRFLDFFKFFPSSLNSLSKTFLNKSKLEFDFTIIKDKTSAIRNMDLALKYCMMDSQLLYEIVLLFNNMCLDVYNISINECLSSSHLSKMIFQQRYLKSVLKGSILEDYDKELSSYHGGMCITYVKGFYNKPIYVYDINSSYPACMLEFMPSNFLKEKEVLKISKITSHYLYYVTFKFPDHSIVCNLATKVEGEMVFLKNGSGWFWGAEIKTALSLDCSISYERVRKYTKEKLFENFVKDIYLKRMESKHDPVLYALYKSILNSLYGKFGQKLRENGYIEKFSSFLDTKLNITDIKMLTNDIAYVSYKDDYQYYNSIGSLVRLSSYITALGRCKILEPILHVSKTKLLYMDTDSLFLTQELNDKWCHPTELGKFKCEVYKEGGIFISAKCYALLPDIKKMKGVNIKNVRLEHYFDLLNTKQAIINTTSSIKSMGGVKIFNYDKIVTDTYYKRRVSNFYTYPLNDINDFLAYKKESIVLKKPKQITEPNINTKLSNIINTTLHNPHMVPVILPHKTDYCSLSVSDYLKHRIIGFYPKMFNKEEQKFVYDYIYNINKVDVREMLFKMYNLKEPKHLCVSNSNKLAVLQQNGMCSDWVDRKLGNLKKLFIELQYNHMINKSI